MKKDYSYGIIPLRKKDKKWEVLLICHQAGHWSFPKGHPDLNEEPQETAIRELKEEVGLNVVYFLPFRPLQERYIFTFQGKKIDKLVTYYLAHVGGDLILQTSELSEAKWVAIEEAESMVTFGESKRLCKQVQSYLTEQSDRSSSLKPGKRSS